MNDRKIVISSLALDLRRVAQGYNRGSIKMADRFFEEALARKAEAEDFDLPVYVKRMLERFGEIKNFQTSKKAEYALMYSTLFQNASLHL